MRLIILFAVMTVAGTATAASAQSPLSDEPIVQVGLFSYRDDGTVQGSAYDTEPSLSSVVYVNGSLCQLGAGNRPQPATAADAWRFTGRVVSKTAEEAVMQLDWQRILYDGRVTVAPGETVQLTLKAGDRLLLDSVLPRTQLSCGVASVGFEARYRTRFSEFPQLREHMKKSSGARAGGASGGGGTFAGGVAISGAGRGAVAAAGACRTDLLGSGNRPRAGRSRRDPSRSRPYGERESLAGTSAPGRDDEVRHQVLSAPHEGAAFAFAPVTINGPGGPATVQVTGSFIVRTNAESGDQQLVFVTNRRVTRGTGQPRDAADQVAPAESSTRCRARTTCCRSRCRRCGRSTDGRRCRIGFRCASASHRSSVGQNRPWHPAVAGPCGFESSVGQTRPVASGFSRTLRFGELATLRRAPATRPWPCRPRLCRPRP